MNIRFEYLYRDAANYKNWGEVVFSNHQQLKPSLIETKIKQHLIDSEFFVAEAVKLPLLKFAERIESLDHDWHQFHAVIPTNEPVDDLEKRDISVLIDSLSKTKDY